MSRAHGIQVDQLLNIKAVVTCGSNQLQLAFFSINLLSSLNPPLIMQRWHLVWVLEKGRAGGVPEEDGSGDGLQLLRQLTNP